MYRVISFWLVLLVGWGLWAQLAVQVRRGRWTRLALDAPVEAELVPEGPAEPGPPGSGEPISAVEK
jgi:hypothetical protein